MLIWLNMFIKKWGCVDFDQPGKQTISAISPENRSSGPIDFVQLVKEGRFYEVAEGCKTFLNGNLDENTRQELSNLRTKIHALVLSRIQTNLENGYFAEAERESAQFLDVFPKDKQLLKVKEQAMLYAGVLASAEQAFFNEHDYNRARALSTFILNSYPTHSYAQFISDMIDS